MDRTDEDRAEERPAYKPGGIVPAPARVAGYRGEEFLTEDDWPSRLRHLAGACAGPARGCKYHG